MCSVQHYVHLFTLTLRQALGVFGIAFCPSVHLVCGSLLSRQSLGLNVCHMTPGHNTFFTVRWALAKPSDLQVSSVGVVVVFSPLLGCAALHVRVIPLPHSITVLGVLWHLVLPR